MSGKKYYCGPSWRYFPDWLRRILSYKFNESCKIHDQDYSSGKLTKEEADQKFLENMLKQAEGSSFWTSMAHAYYRATKMFGSFSWKKDSNAEEDSQS